MRLMSNFLAAALMGLFLGGLIFLPSGHAQDFDTSKLPDLGDASSSVFGPTEEARIGRDVVRQLRAGGALLEDPQIEEYIQGLGQHLAAHSTRPGEYFEFFVVRSDTINAFALPGGYIGINAGLILAADTEAELAGVVAHEIAHVTQRHIARQMERMQGGSLATLSAILGAVIIAASTGASDVAMATAISAQAMQIQRQIDYTRAHEHEADRVGIQILKEAGFNPEGMANFFEKLQQRSRFSAGHGVPEYMRTHPLTANRIAEARNRIDKTTSTGFESNRQFYLTRERLNAMIARRSDRSIVELNAVRSPSSFDFTSELERYRQAFSEELKGNHQTAARLFTRLRENTPDIIAYHIGEAENLMAMGEISDGLAIYETARNLFPGNAPLVESHAQALMQAKRPVQAWEQLLTLLNTRDARPRHHRQIAEAANNAGYEAESYYHMAGFYQAQGDIYNAITQMRLALSHPLRDPRRQARFEERMASLNLAWERLPREVQQAQAPSH